jgi:hypothetical protein
VLLLQEPLQGPGAPSGPPLHARPPARRARRDATLTRLLRQAGPAGDAFSLIASTWLCPGVPPAAVSKADREMAKRVTYGICYGQTPYGLAAALAEEGVDVADATKLLNTFLATFKGGRLAGPRAWCWGLVLGPAA